MISPGLTKSEPTRGAAAAARLNRLLGDQTFGLEGIEVPTDAGRGQLKLAGDLRSRQRAVLQEQLNNPVPGTPIDSLNRGCNLMWRVRPFHNTDVT